MSLIFGALLWLTRLLLDPESEKDVYKWNDEVKKERKKERERERYIESKSK